ncbi:unnamed protein product [Brassicogethes aeneus]|uniref:Nuclear envelope membrane protein n=1 Tax=Brassicogethes aeneus TaxID=1431903 RepID=A0A9P0AS87_BRAAE|nr:unnamed protein product [Brassicogethes aeneus]
MNLINICICIASLLYTFLVVVDLTCFISKPNRVIGSQGNWRNISWALFIDMCLLCLFIIPHSLLVSTSTISQKLNTLLLKLNLRHLHRIIYVIITAGTLQILIKNWIIIPEMMFWNLNMNNNCFWWIYISIHFTAWIVIYVGNICTDITELLGVKQVIYSLSKKRDPNYMKSGDLLRLYSHMRHPSFLAFCLLLWITPQMCLDRLLLSAILTLYMSLTWITNEKDYVYQKYQYIRKYHELDLLEK